MRPRNRGTGLQKIDEWQDVDRSVFEDEIVPANRPAVLRGLLRDWPAVQAGRQSPKRAADYLRTMDTGVAVNAIVGPPEIGGRFSYSEDFTDFNFGPRKVSISMALDTLLSLADEPNPPAIALQALHIPDVMPSFADENAMPLLDSGIAPQVWISNRSTIATHFDNFLNIAGVVSGRRRFTVFPPEQVANLYIGPLLKTPGGSPISTVDPRDPDYERFPRLRDAVESAREAVLEPGDAIYIPILWWHGVESLEPLNVLVNYWWNDTVSAQHKPILALMHSMAAISGLPADQRDAWRAFFDHLVFRDNGEPGSHLPSDLRDLIGKLSPSDKDQVMAFIAERLQQAAGQQAG